jgi:putative tryptophan/tyrosine transport system substrate-binding protein
MLAPELGADMRRREFITLLGGAAAWPLAVDAQQVDRVRRIGVLLPLVQDDPVARAQVGAFLTALHQAGWTDGGNARIEIRWAGPTPSDIRRHAAALVALGPEVVLAYGSSTVGPLLQNTRTVPIVFPVMGDPVAGRLRGEPRETGWQRHRLHELRVQSSPPSGWSCSRR